MRLLLFLTFWAWPVSLGAGCPPRYVDHENAGAYWENRYFCYQPSATNSHVEPSKDFGDLCLGERM